MEKRQNIRQGLFIADDGYPAAGNPAVSYTCFLDFPIPAGDFNRYLLNVCHFIDFAGGELYQVISLKLHRITGLPFDFIPNSFRIVVQFHPFVV